MSIARNIRLGTASDNMRMTPTRNSGAGRYSDHLHHLQKFFASVRSRKPVVEDPTFGLRAAGPALLANQSLYEQKIRYLGSTGDGREPPERFHPARPGADIEKLFESGPARSSTVSSVLKMVRCLCAKSC